MNVFFKSLPLQSMPRLDVEGDSIVSLCSHPISISTQESSGESDALWLKRAIFEALFYRYWLIFVQYWLNTNCMLCRSLSEVINLSSVQLSDCPTWCLIRKIQELDTSRLLDKIPVGKLELNFVKSWILFDKKVFSRSPEKCNIWRIA